MKWNLKLFEQGKNDKPVEEFIKLLDSATIAKIVRHFELLENYGSYLGMPHARKLTKDLYELRIRGKQEIRIIYGFQETNIYLLHAFKKQTQKTPKKEIETALKRLDMIYHI